MKRSIFTLAIMVDFHYSDFWADPKKQNIPASWSGKSYEEIKVLLADHTLEVLNPGLVLKKRRF